MYNIEVVVVDNNDSIVIGNIVFVYWELVVTVVDLSLMDLPNYLFLEGWCIVMFWVPESHWHQLQV